MNKLDDIIVYLERVPHGRCPVKGKDLEGISRGRDPARTLTENVREWADVNNLEVSVHGIGEITYYFTRKKVS